jgi:virulence factor
MSAPAAAVVTRQRLRVGMVGLGGIARRVYLPVLGTRPDLDLRVCTRNQAVLDDVCAAYRIAHGYTELSAMLAEGLDAVFVHAATGAHVDVVRAVLEAGIPVYVDKPLAADVDDARDLVELARRQRTSLFVGFNRRFAPAYRALADEEFSCAVMQKHRVGFPDDARRVIFDDFIHVIDTLRFLIDEARLVDVHSVRIAGDLALVSVVLAGPGRVAVGVMNRDGGATEEVLEIHGPGVKTSVRDLTEVIEDREGRREIRRLDEWTPVEERRGFVAMCDFFVDAVRAGYRLDAGDALRTHELCDEVLRAVSARTP